MLKLLWLTDIGKKMMTAKRLAIASAAGLGLYSFGDEGISYVSTATRMVSEQVGDQVPISFEIERARTMIGQLTPDIKRNMVVIAQEEVGVDTLRKEVKVADQILSKQQEVLLELRKQAESGQTTLKIGSRTATPADIDRELDRRFTRFRLLEATLAAKQDLLASREESLAAARVKLESMLNAKRDLEIQAENLEARLRTLHSDAISHRVKFDDSDVSKCQSLVNDLRARLDVAEKMIVTEGNYEDALVSLPMTNGSVRHEIDTYFAKTK